MHNQVFRFTGKIFDDFVISGINVGRYFRFLANDIEEGRKPPIFGYFVSALRNSNLYRSSKTINFGLLEIMFPAVYARMITYDPSKVVGCIINIMQADNAQDVDNLIDARIEAWKTSTTKMKREFNENQFRDIKSPYEFYMELMRKYDDGQNSNYQWGDQYRQRLPILSSFFGAILISNDELTKAIKESFQQIRRDNPKIKLGIIADMCAAATFLSLSYS